VVIIALLEYAYRNYSTEADRVFKPYYAKANTVETIYIGNSHIGVFNELYTKDVKEVGNMSLGGQDIFRMYTVLSTIVPTSPALKKVYMGLDYDLLGYNQTKSGQEYIDRQYYQYTDTLYNNTMTNRAMSSSHFFRSNRDIAYLFKKHDAVKEDLNFIPVASQPTPAASSTSADTTKVAEVAKTEAPALPHKVHDPFMCRKRAEEHTLLKFKQKNIAENLAYLNEIVKICKQHNVQLIWFDPPKTECYRGYSNKVVVEKARATIDSFAHAQNIPYLDFYSDSTFNDDLFVDYDHLNLTGVKMLDEKLKAQTVR
jgi:hypothetical protein